MRRSALLACLLPLACAGPILRRTSCGTATVFPRTSPIDIRATEGRYPEIAGRILRAHDYIRLVDLYRPRTRPELCRPRIAVGDEVTFDVSNEGVFTFTVPVKRTVDFPRIGRIVFGGRTVAQLRTEMLKRFRRIHRDPEVQISIYASPTRRPPLTRIDVLDATGAVRRRRPILWTGEESIVSCLGTSIALETDWRALRILRRGDRFSGGDLVVVCDLYAYVVEGDVRQDLPLRPGDIVLISGPGTLDDWDLIAEYLDGRRTPPDFVDRWLATR